MQHLRRAAMAVHASMLLAVSGCGGSGTAAETVSVVTLSCKRDAEAPMPTGGVLANNQWGRESAGAGDWPQCLAWRVVEGKKQYGWTWEWPSKPGLYAYPEVVFGRNPWTAMVSNDVRFPRLVSETKAMVLTFDSQSAFVGMRNLAVDLWLTGNKPMPGESEEASLKAELMVWTDYSAGMLNDGEQPVGEVTIDGKQWVLYASQGALGNGSTTKWQRIGYVAKVPTQSGVIDISPFLADAAARGYVQGDNWISGIEFGNEISSGSGSTWFKTLTLDVQAP